jgi:hypothetical protein
MIVAVKQVEFEDRLKEFRAERIEMILANEVPVKMEESGRIVLHIVPQSAFESPAELDLYSIRQGGDHPWPINGWGSGSIRYNFDGLLSVSMGNEYADSYIQLFHNGTVEAVNSSLLKNRPEKLFIASRLFEEEIRKVVSGSIALLQGHGVEAPLHIMLSLLRVKGYRMALDQIAYQERYPIDRDMLLVPPKVLESFESDVDQLLLPAFNRVWNASGMARSPNYDENGKWKER